MISQLIMPPPLRVGALSDDARLTTSVICLTSVAYIVNIHGAHSYWKKGALCAAGVRDGLQLLRNVRRTAGGAYCVATRTACFSCVAAATLATEQIRCFSGWVGDYEQIKDYMRQMDD